MKPEVNTTVNSKEEIEQVARFFDALLESALANGFINKKGEALPRKGAK